MQTGGCYVPHPRVVRDGILAHAGRIVNQNAGRSYPGLPLAPETQSAAKPLIILECAQRKQRITLTGTEEVIEFRSSPELFDIPVQSAAAVSSCRATSSWVNKKVTGSASSASRSKCAPA